MSNFNYHWPENSLKITSEVNKSYVKSSIKQVEKVTKKQADLTLLKEKMQAEEQIPLKKTANFVFSDGVTDADIMLIGEAPGEEEDKQQKPFVGRSGQLLRSFLELAEINSFYITNVIPWRPYNNRTPTLEEIKIMQPYLFEHIKIIKPKVIVTVGATSLKALNISESITSAQGKFFDTEVGKVYPVYHPSYALRVASKKKDLWISLLNLVNTLKAG